MLTRRKRRPFQDLLGILMSRRFVVVSMTIETALVLEGLASYFDRAWLNAGIFGAGAFAVAISAWLARRGQSGRAGLVLLWSMTLMMETLIWRGEGMRDIGMIAFPAILVVGSLVISRRELAVLGVWIVFAAIAQGSAEAIGLVHYVVPAVDWRAVADCAAIMLVTGACVWAMSRELYDTLANLRTAMERSLASQALSEHLASHDHLTGLPNRAAFQTLLQNAIARGARNNTLIAVLFLDLDDFKSVNDSAGHAIGDLLLKRFAERLSQSLRASDTVSRQGGDEFVVILDSIASVAAVSQVIQKIFGAMNAPLELGHLEHVSSCSIGVSLFPQDGTDVEALLKKADIAMYQAKAAGRNTFAFFDELTNNRLLEQIQISQALGRALAANELSLHYQPQISLRDGAVVGAEALLRWSSVTLGRISPQQFVPIAESSGSIIEIGAWVLKEACRQCVAWEHQGLRSLNISVNVSAIQLARGDIVQTVSDALAASRLDPGRLELELTESVFIHDTDRMVATVAALKRLGVRLAMDDFGTGYSSLSYLRRFQLDTLKIDKAFIMRLERGGDDAAIAGAIIDMARALNLSTVAEGIETPRALEFLREHGCATGQGFLFSAPVPSNEFVEWVRTRHEEPVTR